MSTRQHLSRPFAAALVALMLCAVMLPAAQAAPPRPAVSWSPCYRDLGPFQCGTVQVPLDYDNPGAAAISIALVRLPASNPAHRIGSLFLNPGGPGGSGFDFALQLAPLLASVGLGDFDIVGFDPRGIYRSTGLKCFGNTKQFLANEPPFFFPMTSDQEAMLQASDEALVAACDRRAGRIIDHMTTADVARDLDLLREAVGDDQLTYLGFSYGSYLGATYANLFPDRVRAVAVDAVLDPEAYATGVNNEGSTVPLGVRLGEQAGAEAILAEFFRLCDAGGPGNCAFAPDSAARFAALSGRLKAAPIYISMPDGSTLVFTYDLLIINTLVSMYTASTWPELAALLAALEYFATPAELGQRLQTLHEHLGLTTKRGIPSYANYEGQDAVACSDTDEPKDFAVWSAAAAASSVAYPNFGAIWTWIWAGCATWPGPAASRYAGPFDRQTAHPVLIVGSIYDPATPYEGAVALHQLLPNSALLTVDGWGHGSIIMSSCAFGVEVNYLVTGDVPPEGAVCPADVVPFSGSQATLSAQAASSAKWAGALVPDALRRRLR